jgi:tetratricopeptide (TPR) repeat protein
MIDDPKNPYIAGPTVDNTPAFIGRENILGNVLNILCHEGQNAIVLHGQRRIGKTSLLHELKARLSTDIYYPVFFDLLDKPQQSLEKVLQDLANEISRVVQKNQTSLGTEPKIAFCQWLNNLLNELPPEKSLVLLFDEFDVLDDPSMERAGVEFFPYLRNELLTINRKRLNFVFVIGRKIKDMTDIAGSLFREIPTQPVSLLKYEETLELIRLSEQKKTLFWSEEALAKIWQQTSGHPYFTQALCREIWEGTPHKTKGEKIIPEKVAPEEVDKVIPIVLENSEGTLEWLWDGLGPIEKVVTSVLANATGGTAITETQLEHILSESGVQMMIEELESAAELLLKGWELIAPTENNSGYRFRVELLRRWIQENKPLNEAQKELDRIDPIADNLYKASLGLFHKEQFEKALSLAHDAVNINPTHVGANQLLADILIAQKYFIEAREQLEQLYKFKPNAARTRLIRVLLTLAKENEDEDEQLKLYERVLKFETEHPKAKEGLQTIWQQRADHAYEKGDLDNALEAYRKADSDDKVAEIEEKIRTQTHLPEWYQQAQSALQQGDKQKAKTFFAKIIAIDPEYKEVSRYLHFAITNVDPIDSINVIQKLKKSNRKWLLVFTAMTIFCVGMVSTGAICFTTYP